ncbi:protein arv1 homolog isoform X2 [Herrania umbratica]|uniref:Protein ARV n=1 Tax=Herrania umbratica TaxID=108875 RepID=A0A6J0ZZE8_9ROSI|nr:protein arv1 homolog isoform X2 [Herrania umbratica]
MKEGLMEYRCVQCGFQVKTLFVQYSPGNIRLMKCEKCKAVADEYIECELMIVLIDLILHKPKAYRHLLYNVLNQQGTYFQGLLWKLLFGFLVLDAYRSLLVKRHDEKWGMSMSISSYFWLYRKILVDVFLGNFMFLCCFLLAIRKLLKTSAQFFRLGKLLLAVLISSYFKILLVAMMVCFLMLRSYFYKICCWLLHFLLDFFSSICPLVIQDHPSNFRYCILQVWEFPPSVIYIIDLLVLSSNTVALKVITESDMNPCVGACFIAHAVKFCTTQAF